MLKKANTADFYRSLDMTKMYSIFFYFFLKITIQNFKRFLWQSQNAFFTNNKIIYSLIHLTPSYNGCYSLCLVPIFYGALKPLQSLVAFSQSCLVLAEDHIFFHQWELFVSPPPIYTEHMHINLPGTICLPGIIVFITHRTDQ